MPENSIELRAQLQKNLAHVGDRIARAALRAGRSAADVRLVAVTKYASLPVIRGLIECGVTDLGESRVQQLVERATHIPGRMGAGGEPGSAHTWHMIGHLQRNKVRTLLRCCRMVHSVDSVRLVEELEAEAAGQGGTVDALVEVNVAGEAQKHGITPADAPPLLARVALSPHLHLRGLMTMAPASAAGEAARPHFARLRELLERYRIDGLVDSACTELSMGMSQDFEVAIEEGATMVRIGSVLFEGVDADV